MLAAMPTKIPLPVTVDVCPDSPTGAPSPAWRGRVRVGADRTLPTPRRSSARLQPDPATHRCSRTAEFSIPAAGDSCLAADRHCRRVVRRQLQTTCLPQGRRNPRCTAGSDAVAENGTRAGRGEVLSTARVPPRHVPTQKLTAFCQRRPAAHRPHPDLPRQRGRGKIHPAQSTGLRSPRIVGSSSLTVG